MSDDSASVERVKAVIRADVRALTAYPVADAQGMVKLDMMESPYQLPAALLQELSGRLAQLAVNRYPSPRPEKLGASLRTVFGIPAKAGLVLGNGSDELINLIAIAVADPKASILAPLPGFVMYEASARLARLRFIGVPLGQDFTLDMPAMLEAIEREQPRVLYIAYPNNPTGNLFTREDVETLIAASPGLVVIDEAYQAFAGASFMNRVLEFPNLLVMRTLSKSGMAGARLGYLAAAPAWTDELDKVRPPFNVNVFTQAYVEFALAHQAVLDEQAALLRAARGDLAGRLGKLEGIEVFPSDANFLLFRLASPDPAAASRVFEALRERRILIKNVSGAHPLLANCLRVTVSTPAENALFLDALGASMRLAH